VRGRARRIAEAPSDSGKHKNAAVSERPKPENRTYMYVYDEYDQRIIEDRVKQFRDQTRRYLAGELSEEEFRPLRLQNGLYIQRFAPMLRVAVPYGQLTSRQVRMMAKIARDYDKGYAHISTRQNVQFNWPPCRCTRSRPAATACATSLPTSSPA
jgi:sulfite reductase (NADPH) hemoprotein beta-component